MKETLETFPKGNQLDWMAEFRQELRAREKSKRTLF